MLKEYHWEIIENNRPVIIKIVAQSKEQCLEKIRSFYDGEAKLLDVRSIY